MATTRVRNNSPSYARPEAAWRRRTAVGVSAWVAFGMITAFFDPRFHGTGFIGICGGVGAWAAMGAGLAASYAIAHAAFQGRGRAAGLLAGGLSLAVVSGFLTIVDWNAIVQSIVNFIFVAIGLALCLISSRGERNASDESINYQEINGWECGPDGPGFYIHDIRQDD